MMECRHFFYKLHTSELEDGYEWGRLNLQSVTEQNQLDDFLATAELAGTEFTAEKLNIEVRPAAQRCCSNMYCLLIVHSLKLLRIRFVILTASLLFCIYVVCNILKCK